LVQLLFEITPEIGEHPRNEISAEISAETSAETIHPETTPEITLRSAHH
jgi:hypothetical protein